MKELAKFLLFWLSSTFFHESMAQLPTTYEYFTEGGISSGLTADTPGFFKLNGKDLRIISGAMHYFRVHPSLWRDRLKKLRAAGLNTVETYVPWNLHEPQQGAYDFGDGNDDFSSFLNVRQFLQIAQEEDLLVLFRPGPYICSEWDFGGLPSWLQRDPDMKVRTSYQPYLDRVRLYMNQLLPLIVDLQFTRGGPVIAIQLENEYGSFSPVDKKYMEFIKVVYEENGIDALYFTSDGPWNGVGGALPEVGVLLTANFQDDPVTNMNLLLNMQPNRPAMVMEFWAGWFDHWGEKHHVTPVKKFTETVETILSQFNGSINFYMFHGGTNFGFMAGANFRLGSAPFYDPDVTSYDYDAPLSEAGDYTPKFEALIELIERYQVPALHRPTQPPQSEKEAYPNLRPLEYLTYEEFIDQIPPSAKFSSDRPISMEMLPFNQESGQSYGYIIYRTLAPVQSPDLSLVVDGPVKDFGVVIINGEIQPTPNYWMNSALEVALSVPNAGNLTIDIFVENTGRINFGNETDFLQQKGLPSAAVSVNGLDVNEFEIIAAEFKGAWIRSLKNWYDVGAEIPKAPALFRTVLEITGTPKDTFIELNGWHKGVVFVNYFNVGRYWKIGPTQTLYVPAPLLRSGTNTIIIFEQLEAGTEIAFSDSPKLGDIEKIKRDI